MLLGSLLVLGCFGQAQSSKPAGPPWVVIERPPPQRYSILLGPQLVRFEDGTYVASFEHEGHYGSRCGTYVCRSRDHGQSWTTVAKLDPPRNTSLFARGEELFMLGIDGSGRGDKGRIMILRSEDQGETWTTPASGLLREDADLSAGHVPILEHGGRYWRPYFRITVFPDGQIAHYARVLSVPKDADLLRADAWGLSNEIQISAEGVMNFSWSVMLGQEADEAPVLLLRRFQVIESLAETSADGSTLRMKSDSTPWTTCRRASARLLWDAKTKSYIAVRGATVPPPADETRYHSSNALELAASTNLETWELRSTLLRAPADSEMDFGWGDWLIEGDDLLVIQAVLMPPSSESTPDEAPRRGMVFLRVPKFRDRKPEDPPLWGPALPK